jgi:hypothetical protein
MLADHSRFRLKVAAIDAAKTSGMKQRMTKRFFVDSLREQESIAR